MPRNLSLSVALLSALSLNASPLSAQSIDASNPFDLMQLIRAEGYKAELSQDSDGDPMLKGRISDTNWSMFFFGCEENRNCDIVKFSAGYDLQNGVSAAKVNEWNRSKLFGQAFVDEEGDPFIEMTVNLDGGVSEENFADTFDWWRIVVEGFEEHIDWR